MPATQTADALIDRANELYWNSDQTIDQIVEEVRIGRSALYSSLRPVPAGIRCRECDGDMVFANRTGRETGSAVCEQCGARADAEPAPQEREAEPVAVSGGWARWREDLASVEPERAAMVGGAAALGVMVGAAAARAVRTRL